MSILRRISGSERGGMMVEAVMMLGMMSMVTPYMFKQNADRQAEMQDVAVANQTRAILDAANAYVEQNYSAIAGGDNLGAGEDFSGAGTEFDVSIDTLKARGFLPNTVRDANAFGQTYSVRLKKQDIGGGEWRVDALLNATGGDASIDQVRGTRIAAMVGSGGGYVAADNNASGAMGAWSADTSTDYGLNTAAGDLVATTSYQRNVAMSDGLYRNAVPGFPDANTMGTNLRLAGNNINMGVFGTPGSGGNIDMDGGDVTNISLVTVNRLEVGAGGLDVEGISTLHEDFIVRNDADTATMFSIDNDTGRLGVGGAQDGVHQARIYGTARVDGNVGFGGDADGVHDIHVYGSSQMDGNVGFGGVADASHDIRVYGTSRMDGNVGIGRAADAVHDLAVQGTSTFGGNIGIGRAADANALSVNGSTLIDGNTTVNGDTILNGRFTSNTGGAVFSVNTAGGNAAFSTGGGHTTFTTGGGNFAVNGGGGDVRLNPQGGSVIVDNAPLVVEGTIDAQKAISNSTENNNGRVYVNDDMQVTGRTYHDDNLYVGGGMYVIASSGNINTTGIVAAVGNINTSSSVNATLDVNASRDVNVGEDLNVTGLATLKGGTDLQGFLYDSTDTEININDGLKVRTYAEIGDVVTISQSGAIFTDSLKADNFLDAPVLTNTNAGGGIWLKDTDGTRISGDVTIDSGYSITASKVNVTDAITNTTANNGGNVLINDSVNVNGAANISNNLNVAGNSYFGANKTIINGSTGNIDSQGSIEAMGMMVSWSGQEFYGGLESSGGQELYGGTGIGGAATSGYGLTVHDGSAGTARFQGSSKTMYIDTTGHMHTNGNFYMNGGSNWMQLNGADIYMGGTTSKLTIDGGQINMGGLGNGSIYSSSGNVLINDSMDVSSSLTVSGNTMLQHVWTTGADLGGETCIHRTTGMSCMPLGGSYALHVMDQAKFEENVGIEAAASSSYSLHTGGRIWSDGGLFVDGTPYSDAVYVSISDDNKDGIDSTISGENGHAVKGYHYGTNGYGVRGYSSSSGGYGGYFSNGNSSGYALRTGTGKVRFDNGVGIGMDPVSGYGLAVNSQSKLLGNVGLGTDAASNASVAVGGSDTYGVYINGSQSYGLYVDSGSTYGIKTTNRAWFGTGVLIPSSAGYGSFPGLNVYSDAFIEDLDVNCICINGDCRSSWGSANSCSF